MAEKSIIPLDEFEIDDGTQILDAIRTGCVDAFVVEEREGHAVYTLDSADLPYSTLVQRMQQGAAMLNPAGQVIYCNPSLAALLGNGCEDLVGRRFEEFILAEDRPVFQRLLDQIQQASQDIEIRLLRREDAPLPAGISLISLSRDKSVMGVLVQDLTSVKSLAELASRMQSVEDEERKKIARELHDSVGQLLTALAMNVSRLRNEAPNLAPTAADLLSDCSVMLDEVSREIRTISHLLHPPLLDVAGLYSAIRWYVDGFSHRSNIKVELQTDAELGRLPEEIEICLFRVVQECLTNVYRHSGSNFCSIAIRRNGQQLHLEIRDTGHGIQRHPDGKIPDGVGLRGMQERLRRLGGTLQMQSSSQGTLIIVDLPLPAKSQS